MITLKLHQLLQALDFALSKTINDNEAIFDANVTLKVLHAPDGDLALYAWMSDRPEDGSFKLEAELPEDMLSSFDVELAEHVDTTSLDPDEVYFNIASESSLHPEFVEYYEDMIRNDA